MKRVRKKYQENKKDRKVTIYKNTWKGKTMGNRHWESRENKHPGSQAQRQEDEHPGRQAQKREDKHPGRQVQKREDKQPGRQVQRQEVKHPGRQTQRREDEHPGRQVQKREDKQPGRQTQRQEVKHPNKQVPTHGVEHSGRQSSSARKSMAKSICPVASACGGCRWIDRSYEEQLQEKRSRLRKLMEPYCRLEDFIAMEQPAHYRNKVHAVFGEDRKHNIISGIYEEKSHRIVPVDSCYIENQKADEIIVSIREMLRSFKIRPYNEDTGYGLLRHVLVRMGHVTGQILVVLVLSSPIMPSKNNFVKALLKQHPEITTIVVNVNDRDTSMVLGDREQVLYGRGYIEDVLCGKTFQISPRSFYQVNPVQTEKLYEKALEYAGLTGKETVLDAYCGTGTIGIIASADAAKVIGVELNKEAVRDAVSNAKRNNISNIRFYQNDAGKFLMQMAEQQERLDVLLMDPPRSGSDEAFLSSVAAIHPARIVYISCNPDTLVRDLQFLQKKGYRAERCVGVDMFPFTSHVETIVSIQKKNS